MKKSLLLLSFVAFLALGFGLDYLINSTEIKSNTKFDDKLLGLAFEYPEYSKITKSTDQDLKTVLVEYDSQEAESDLSYSINFSIGDNPRQFVFGSADYLYIRNPLKDKSFTVDGKEYMGEYYSFDDSEPAAEQGKVVYRFSKGDTYLIALRSDMLLRLSTNLERITANEAEIAPEIVVSVGDQAIMDKIINSIDIGL